jgi:nucleoid-associated protein Lsr2
MLIVKVPETASRLKMARKVEVQLIDDMDGSKAEETIRFSLDGVSYEIDLSKKNAAKLRSGLEPYVKAGQKLTRARVHPVSARGRGSAAADREQNQAIREWAERKGLQVSPRGRISRSILQQYEAEAGR